MKKKTDPETFPGEEDIPKNLGNGVRVAFGILLLHVLLLLGIGLLVLLLKGLIHYVSLIFLAAFIFLGFLAYLLFRKFKKSRTDLEGILRNPDFADKNLEIRLLGGLASLRMGDENPKPLNSGVTNPLLLESPQSLRIRELTELGTMYEKNLLTLEEYEMAKKEIFQNFKTNNDPHPLIELANPSDPTEAK